MTQTRLQAAVRIAVEALDDRSKTGRPRPWREKKMANELLAAAYDSIDPKKAARLRDCATFLAYGTTPEGDKLLRQANFCRVRLCPICSWRRSLKAWLQVHQVVTEMQGTGRYAYALLTLTVRSCKADELSAAIDGMMAGWNRLTRRVDFQRAVKGWYRSLEITHNTDIKSPSYDTFHPHFHVLLAVNPSYFTSRLYLSQARWQELWARSARLPYDPSVDIRKVKGDSPKAIAEVAKYAAKDADYILPDDWDLTISTVAALDAALDSRRCTAWGGVMAEVHKRLHLDDAEDGDLIRVDGEEAPQDDPAELMCFYWYSGYRQYYRTE